VASFYSRIAFLVAATFFLTEVIEINPASEATSCVATPKLLNILWSQNLYYHVHKNSPLVLVLHQLIPVHTTKFCLRTTLILPIHLHLGLPSGLFPSGVPTNIL
jgi:hypothetical protein